MPVKTPRESTEAPRVVALEPEQMRSADAEDDAQGLNLADYVALARRRVWYFVIPAVLAAIAAVAYAYSLPEVYRSTATILIEQQQIPRDLVRSTVTSYADQRIQNIRQRVMTTANLTPVIEKYDLYPGLRRSAPMSTVAGVMRRNVGLDMVSADVVDPESGRARRATIAFTLSFDSQSPTQAQEVTNELVTLFLDENLKRRQEAAQETSQFLEAEAERLAGDIADLEAKVARFKEEKGDMLPDMQSVNAQALQRTEDALARNALEQRLIEERILVLESELAQTPRYGSGDPSRGNQVMTPEDRLVQLELEYIQLSTRLKDNHPDMVLLRQELEALRAQTGGLPASELEQLLAEARAELAEQRDALQADHPDVQAALGTVASLEARLERAREREENGWIELRESPEYVQLETRLEAARSELAHLGRVRANLESDFADYQARLEEAPKVEREFKILTRDYDNALTKYREVKSKQLEAELAQSLESERKSERFVLIEPPVVPAEPYKPDRMQLLFVGFVLALGGGAGTVVLREMLDGTVHSTRDVALATGAAAVAMIPYFKTDAELARRRRQLVMAGLLAVAMLAAGLVFVHVAMRPLDLAAWQVLQRLGVVGG